MVDWDIFVHGHLACELHGVRKGCVELRLSVWIGIVIWMSAWDAGWECFVGGWIGRLIGIMYL